MYLADNWLQYLSFSVGVIGVLIGIFQGFQRKKLQQFVYSQAWHIFTVAGLAYASAQKARGIYKDKHGDNIDIEILEHLSMCDAHNFNLFIESIRQIQLTEPKFNMESIALWEYQGKIYPNQKEYFIKAMPRITGNIFSLLWAAVTIYPRSYLGKVIANAQKEHNARQNGKTE
jgi:hypothetical protein